MRHSIPGPNYRVEPPYFVLGAQPGSVPPGGAVVLTRFSRAKTSEHCVVWEAVP